MTTSHPMIEPGECSRSTGSGGSSLVLSSETFASVAMTPASCSLPSVTAVLKSFARIAGRSPRPMRPETLSVTTPSSPSPASIRPRWSSVTSSSRTPRFVALSPIPHL